MHPPRKQSLPPTANHSSYVPPNSREPVVTPSSSWRSDANTSSECAYPEHPGHGAASKTGSVAALRLKKRNTHQTTSNPNINSGSVPIVTQAAHESASSSNSSRRHASMPHSRTAPTLTTGPTTTPSLNQAQIDIANDRRARAHAQYDNLLSNPGSPPIVDFTRFEDTYRGPRSGTFEGLVPGTKTGQRSASGGCFRRQQASPEGIKMKDRYPAFRPTRAGDGVMPQPHPHHQEPASTPAATTVSATSRLGLAPALASARKPDPRRVLSALEGMLGDEYKISDYLNAHELLGMHQLDQLDFEERDRARATFIQTGKLHVKRGEKGVISVLGEPIRTASIYSSVPVVLSGREHEIPIIVVNTVEELYRTGIYQANLFRHLPNRGRLMELINIYDSEEQPPGSIIRPRQPSSASAGTRSINGRARADTTAKSVHPGFGAMTSLHLESTPDVCALLTTYISSLREPVLCRFLFRAIWDWCGVGDELETEEHGGAASGYPASSFAPRLSSIPLARTYTSPEDATRIATAQLLLHLLPSPHFSLLVYLLAFFSQVALVREENGVGVADLARMYGARIFGGGDVVQDGDRTHTGDGETMMRWFLRRWATLSDGLFDVLDEASMGLFRRTHVRRDSFGKDILSSWSSINGDAKGEEDDESSRHIVDADFDDMDHIGDAEDDSILDSLTPVRDGAFGRSRPATPAAKTTRSGDYFAAGFDMGDACEAQSARSKLLRAYSISDRSLNDFGVSPSADADVDDFVVLSSTRRRADDILGASPQVSKECTSNSASSDEYYCALDPSMSNLIDETMPIPPLEHKRESFARCHVSVPDITIGGATPPSRTPTPVRSRSPAPVLSPITGEKQETTTSSRLAQSTIIATPGFNREEEPSRADTKGELEGALQNISKLRQENATLHNSVWRLEAELAQLRRDMYAANSSGFHAPAVDLTSPAPSIGSKNVETRAAEAQDAEAVKIVAEIRKLMAKN